MHSPLARTICLYLDANYDECSRWMHFYVINDVFYCIHGMKPDMTHKYSNIIPHEINTF